MARTPEEKEAEAKLYDGTDKASMPDYPWGLTIRLDHNDVKKLGLEGIDETKPLKVHGVAMVTEYSSSMVNGAKRLSLSLQMQKLCVEPEGKSESDADVLYGQGHVNTVSLDG